MGWIAYVDESMRLPRTTAPSRPHPRNEEGAYILAATMLDDADVETVREQTKTLMARQGIRFHWRDESQRYRSVAVGLIKRLSALHLVVVGSPLDPSRQERGRRLCLRRLLFDLEAHGVARIVMEARTRSLNDKDMSAVDAWRSQHLINRATRISHANPTNEPLLWLPDIIAGATNASETGETCWIEEVAPLVTVSRITLQ